MEYYILPQESEWIFMPCNTKQSYDYAINDNDKITSYEVHETHRSLVY